VLDGKLRMRARTRTNAENRNTAEAVKG